MKQELLEAQEGVRLSIYTGMLEHGHPDRMATLHFYRAMPGSQLLLLDTVYEFAVAVYTLERDDTYIYTYAYQKNESWAVFDSAVQPNEYYRDRYLFERECYFRVNLRRRDNRTIDSSEAAHINDILCWKPQAAQAGQRTQIQQGYDEDIPAEGILQNPAVQEEIEDTAAKLRAAQKKGGIYAFLLLTDSHYVVNGTWEDTICCIREVDRRAPFDGVIHLGDMTDGMVSRRVNSDYVQAVKQDLFSLQKPLYMVIGNHDTNYFMSNPERFTKEEQYWLYQSDCCDNAVREGHALYYYKDFEDMLVRAVFLHSFDECEETRYGFSEEEILWLQQTLKTVPQAYRVLVFSHVPPLPEIHYWSKDIRNGEKIVGVLEEYVRQDTTHCVLGWIHGHNHADQIYRERLFPIVSLGCTKVEDFKDKKPDHAVTYDRVIGDVSQELWTVMLVERDSTKVELIRFGAGEDQAFDVSAAAAEQAD
ncbi:MAG: metallophosphoesterase [Lachnospiraceae bacterium]|nr:metallophosphoesterase [Lachnospiraceae bacterium]